MPSYIYIHQSEWMTCFTHTGPLEKTSGSDYPSLETTSIIMRTGRLSIRGCLAIPLEVFPGDPLNQLDQAMNCAFVSEVRVLECSDGRTTDAVVPFGVFVGVRNKDCNDRLDLLKLYPILLPLSVKCEKILYLRIK